MSGLIVPSLVVAMLLALGTVTGACGGGEELTLEQYFQQMQAITAEAVEEADALDEQIDDLEEEDFEGLRGLFVANTAITSETFDEMDGVDPPAEAQGAHNEFVAAGRQMVELMEAFGDDLADVESTSELEQAFDTLVGLEAATARIDAACLALKEIATDNGIEVDLDCDE